MIMSFGLRGLPVFHAGHCDWQRPHSVHVAMSSRSSLEVVDAPDTKRGVVGRILEVDWFAVDVEIGRSGPSAFGRREYMTLIGATKMCRCLLQHDQQEDQDDADVRQHEDGF